MLGRGGQGQPAHPAGPLPAPAVAPRPGLGSHRDQAHGRIEHRALKVVTVHRIGFPRAAQILQVTRKRTVGVPHASTRRRRWLTVTVYVITSLGFVQASTARLADLLRGR
jgi:hypothetical protein